MWFTTQLHNFIFLINFFFAQTHAERDMGSHRLLLQQWWIPRQPFYDYHHTGPGQAMGQGETSKMKYINITLIIDLFIYYGQFFSPTYTKTFSFKEMINNKWIVRRANECSVS